MVLMATERDDEDRLMRDARLAGERIGMDLANTLVERVRAEEPAGRAVVMCEAVSAVHITLGAALADGGVDRTTRHLIENRLAAVFDEAWREADRLRRQREEGGG